VGADSGNVFYGNRPEDEQPASGRAEDIHLKLMRQPMSEERYRKIKVILFAIAIFGGLFIGWRWSQVGRYQQLRFGSDNWHKPTEILDTCTGEIHLEDWKK